MITLHEFLELRSHPSLPDTTSIGKSALLSFAAERAGEMSEPVAMVLAVRDRQTTALDASGLPAVTLEGPRA